MTDRCATNTVTDRLLSEAKGTSLLSLKCAMHPLDSMAKEDEKVVKTYERDGKMGEDRKPGSYPYQHRGESLTQATVRTAAKLFHDTAFNCDEELVSHLKEQGAVPHEKLNCVGNRFHIDLLPECRTPVCLLPTDFRVL